MKENLLKFIFLRESLNSWNHLMNEILKSPLVYSPEEVEFGWNVYICKSSLAVGPDSKVAWFSHSHFLVLLFFSCVTQYHSLHIVSYKKWQWIFGHVSSQCWQFLLKVCVSKLVDTVQALSNTSRVLLQFHCSRMSVVLTRFSRKMWMTRIYFLQNGAMFQSVEQKRVQGAYGSWFHATTRAISE